MPKKRIPLGAATIVVSEANDIIIEVAGLAPHPVTKFSPEHGVMLALIRKAEISSKLHNLAAQFPTMVEIGDGGGHRSMFNTQSIQYIEEVTADKTVIYMVRGDITVHMPFDELIEKMREVGFGAGGTVE